MNALPQQRPVLASEVAVVTPTKGRPKQLHMLLTTLAEQTVRIGQILIADGGADAEPVVAPFMDRLPVRWLRCPEPGQIVQREYALKQLRPEIRVVIYFDDDIQLQPNAIETLLAFWNAQAVAPAGVGFNITNVPTPRDTAFRRLFGISLEPKGKVLPSGYNTTVANVPEDLRSEWLLGGATAWRRDLLETRRNAAVNTRWAICEDLIFSYPIGKREPLFVCADARVLHVDDTPLETYRAGLFRGRNAVLWRYYFVATNPELSKPRFFWAMTGHVLSRFVSGFTGNAWQFGYVLGYLAGMGRSAMAMVTGTDVRRYVK